MPNINLDFTPKHNWTEVLPKALALLGEGRTITAAAAELGVPRSLLTQKIAKARKAKQAGQANSSGGEGNLRPFSPDAPATIESSKAAARRLLHDAVTGRADPTAQQVAAARLFIKEELDATAEHNPYAALPEDELAERVLTMAASVLGVARCTAILSDLAKAGTADVLSGGAPDIAQALKPSMDASQEGGALAQPLDLPPAIEASSSPLNALVSPASDDNY